MNQRPPLNEFNLSCPQCSRDDAIQIRITTWAALTPDGTEADISDHEWDDSALCRCGSCRHLAAVHDFRLPHAAADQLLTASASCAESFSRLEMEAAACIWEELECRSLGAADSHHEIAQWRSDHGTVTLRHAAIDLARYACSVYDEADPSLWDGHLYDWEVIPAILDTVVWSPSGPPVRADIKAAADLALAALQRNAPRAQVAGKRGSA